MYIRNIETILLKYFSGDATIEEVDFLEEWISDNQQEYIDAVKVYFSTIESKQHIDTDLAYQKFIEKINEVKVVAITKPKLTYKILKYAAVFIGVSISSFLLYQNIYKQDLGLSVTNVKAYDRATLVLADGTEVVLEEHQNEEIKTDAGVKIVNNAKVLKYSTVDNSVNTDPSKVAYNTLHVPNGGIYQIELPDGSKVWLNSATSLKFPTQFVGNQRVVSIDGEAYFEIQKDKKKPFIVKTETAAVTVLGTHFNVNSYSEDDFFATTLVEGSVQLSASNPGGATMILKPGQKGSLFKDNNSSISVKEVDVYQEIAWKDGKFFFEKEKLGTIIAKLSRWYNVDFIFENQSVANYTFTGVAKKDQPVEYLLDIISKTSDVRYEIVKKTKTNRKLIKIRKK
ncbi:FecR family protein [Flavobacterium rhamnosiphilum]|uniref:FecR family protein n=1 Tax=Flavobacterium rhamnosiphilum TaxID=2541724 RepID=A0A4R5FCL8_9FLAO|nr:FecR family protein [Flavobacterium rhamnosiphilum]TDE46578.1 FecR family protein [Flavobacterium rhamnosiphilum]